MVNPTVFVFYVVLIICAFEQYHCRDTDKSRNPTIYKIGGVLSNNESEDYFKNTIAVSIFTDNL